jgi:hypothetical protein
MEIVIRTTLASGAPKRDRLVGLGKADLRQYLKHPYYDFTGVERWLSVPDWLERIPQSGSKKAGQTYIIYQLVCSGKSLIPD